MNNILAKYRAKGPSEKSNEQQKAQKEQDNICVNQPSFDSNSLFLDAKKKLRHVLSNSHTLYIQSKHVRNLHSKIHITYF